jgi:DNA-binding MarR family transcriptional regulator
MKSGRDEHIALVAEALPQVTVALMSRHPVQAGDWEMTMAQMRALMAVGWGPGCTMGELASRLGIGVSAATGLVDKLVERGALVRESDPADRRVVRVRMSPAGIEAGQEYQAAQVRHMTAALSALSDEDIRRVAEAMTLLHQAVSGEQRGTSPSTA